MRDFRIRGLVELWSLCKKLFSYHMPNFEKLSQLAGMSIYYINTSEIPSELSRENFISSHVKRSPSLWLHNKSRLWKQADLVFHWCLYNKQNITYSLMDMNFIFSCSTRYLTSERSERVRYRVEHEKIKFISTRGHVISSIYFITSKSYKY